MIILLKLLLAHLIGDFLLQPNSWVKAKEEKKLGAWQLYFHVFLHGLLTMVLVWQWSFWKWALLISFVHLLIDAAKNLITKNNNRRMSFFVDQLFHVISIYLIWLWFEGKSLPFFIFSNQNYLFLITATIFLTMPVSIAIKIFISKWTPHTENNDPGSLESAGKYIGILERLFVFIFIISNEWQAIGFLLAAKSIFRFGDLKESKDRRLTEYVLIGTLLSFGVAFVTGIAYQHLKAL